MALIWENLAALRGHYGPAMDGAAEKLGIPAGEWYGWLMAARIFEPETVSTRRLHVRAAYTAPAKLEAALERGAALGLLEPVGAEEYRLTAAGRAGVERIIQTAYAVLAALRPLPEGELQRLAGLLQRVVEASLAAPEPPAKWCLRKARHLDPGVETPVMERLDQYLSDLDAYRDDARLAAWKPYGVSGQAWEAFTLLWRGAAKTLDELCGKLVRRGFTREDYAGALQELVERGWVAEGEAGYSLTDRGRALRQEAETTTDCYFYEPWRRLSEGETAEVRELLTRLRDGISSA
jgi:hypothetical protein